MSDKKPKRKVNTRWRVGAARYDAKQQAEQQAEIDKKYHEAYGWNHGAKVRRR